jgi:hypothetical protein
MAAMRKLALHLLLPLVLLFSQQVAAWHALAHLVSGAHRAVAASGPGVPDGAADVCPQCLAGAHLAFSLVAQPTRLPLLQGRHEPAVTPLLAGLPAEHPTARGRGPPSQLS